MNFNIRIEKKWKTKKKDEYINNLYDKKKRKTTNKQNSAAS